jgi:hypothetical protein
VKALTKKERDLPVLDRITKKVNNESAYKERDEVNTTLYHSKAVKQERERSKLCEIM